MSRLVLAFLALIPLLGSFGQSLNAAVPWTAAQPWPEADLLFRQSSHWLGSDGAFSISLGDDRTLWLFGDSWIDASGSGSRKNGRMVRNSIAIQTGLDPSAAKIEFHWKTDADGDPSAFFGTNSGEWYWPGHGVRLDDGLILFMNRLRSSSEGLGFESAGWDAVLIRNPDDNPGEWNMLWLDTPTNELGIQVGFAGVLHKGDYLYAFGSADPDKTHPVYAVRWDVERAANGNLDDPEWWAGEQAGWASGPCGTVCAPIMTDGQSEMTIHFNDRTGQFIATQTVGFGKAVIAMRTAPSVTGRWSGKTKIFDPPENSRPNVMIYAAKAHPQLEGADLVLTYATNTAEFAEHLSDADSYYPHFVRLSR